MAEITLDQALPVVRNLAERKANAFVRRCRLATDEREDVESHLVLRFLVRWPNFDSGRASIQTFASRLMDKELTSILRYRLADVRRPQDLPMEETGPAFASVRQFRIDLERAMSPLPSVVRETALTLCWLSTGETAERLGCSRQMVSRRKQLIRKALLSAGVGPDYFVAGGGR